MNALDLVTLSLGTWLLVCEAAVREPFQQRSAQRCAFDGPMCHLLLQGRSSAAAALQPTCRLSLQGQAQDP